MNIYRLKSIYYNIATALKRKSKKWSPLEDSKVSRAFVEYSNQYYLKKMKKKNIKPEEILVLMPHCVQNFNCPHKVTSYIENCKKCGLCKIEKLLILNETYGIAVKIATGGTLARKVIMDIRPKFVIAVACERDLVTGIYDIYPLPVYGIFNSRPNGACVSTDFSITQVEEVVSVLLKKN